MLYDAFGASQTLEKDWGFAALIEYGGRRILFDTGNNARIFKSNVQKLGVDLKRLDAVVISHRHGDHTTGLSYLLDQNPNVTIFAPQEGAMFKSVAPAAFFEADPSLPPELRYFDGKPPAGWRSGTPWEKANFRIIRLAVVVGCSHPGVERILENAAKIDPKLYTVTGGFHLVMTPAAEVQRTVNALHDTLKVERVAPGHCTSERGFAMFMDRFKDRFDRTGVGAAISLP